MKRILFTILYPFWFFLAKTWLGTVLMICIIPVTPALIINALLPELINSTLEENKDTAVGLAIFSLLISPFFAMLLMEIGDYLEKHYKKWGYKTEETY